MKIILSSESKKWSWSLRNGGGELARCELYDNFIDARINAEAFRIGARSPVTLDAHDAKKFRYYLRKDKYRLIFSVLKTDTGFKLSVIYPENILLLRDVHFDSFRAAEVFAEQFSNDVFDIADIVNEWEQPLHPLQHSRFYREMFDINDDHPSSL